MRAILALLCLVTGLVFSVACSSTDQERARQRAKEAERKSRAGAERARVEAQKLGRQAEQEAHILKGQINRALQPGTAHEQGASAEENLRNGSAEAGAELSHAALIAKVKATLARQAGLSTVTNVYVDANGSVVTLRGTVDSEAQKQAAEQAVAKINGVSKVVDKLEIRP
jgi:osmotically-inducible protein OsmY